MEESDDEVVKKKCGKRHNKNIVGPSEENE